MKEIMVLKKPTSSNLNYRLYNIDGKEVCNIREAICFGSLNVYNRKDSKPKHLVFTIKSPTYTDKPVTELYSDYLTQTSPFRDAFAKECLPHVRETSNLVVNLSKPANLAISAATATRLSHEKHHTYNWRKGYIWYELVEKGIDPDLALMVSMSIHTERSSYSTLNKLKISKSLDYINHSFTSSINDEFVHNYINNNRVKLEISFRSKGKYAGLSSLFNPNPNKGREYKFVHMLNDFLRDLKSESSSGVVNPFAAQQLDRKLIKIPDFIDGFASTFSNFNYNDWYEGDKADAA